MKVPTATFLFALLCSNVCYSADRLQKVTVKCSCVMATSGCSSALFYKFSGENIHTWNQDIFVKKDEPQQALTLACYRKREAAGQGDHLCCEPDSTTYEEVKKFIIGKKVD